MPVPFFVDIQIMNYRKPVQLEFTDCSNCGKRIAVTARKCHHCQATFSLLSPVRANPLQVIDEDKSISEEDDNESHMALSHGGYDDYDDQAEDETHDPPRKNLWWYVAWVLLIVFAFSALLPWFL